MMRLCEREKEGQSGKENGDIEIKVIMAIGGCNYLFIYFTFTMDVHFKLKAVSFCGCRFW